jgi:AcrR family transcriptional regulator
VATRRITRSDIVETAVLFVDRDGWQRITMTQLAQKLGVRVQNLYTHVANLEEVLSDVQTQAHAQLAQRFQRAAMGKVGAEGFRALAAALRAFALEHRGLYQLAMTKAIDAEGVFRASEPSGAALDSVIESFGRSSSRHLQMKCLALLHGVLALEATDFYDGVVDSAEVFDEAVDMVAAMLAQGDPG